MGANIFPISRVAGGYSVAHFRESNSKKNDVLSKPLRNIFPVPMKLPVPVSSLIGRLSLLAVVLCLLFLNSDFESWAQTENLRVGYSGPLPIAVSASELTDEFHLGEPKQREDLLSRLGVNSQIAHDASVATVETAIRVDELSGTGMSVLFLPCVGPGVPTAHLVLLRPVAKQGWRVSDDEPLDCWFQEATYQLLSIPGHAQQALLAHHVNYGHGSGYVQDDIVLFQVEAGHLSTALRTAEYKREDVVGDDKTVEYQSTLQPFPDGSLEETRATSVYEWNDRANREQARLTGIERRRWRWDKTSLRFVAGGVCAGWRLNNGSRTAGIKHGE